MCKYFLLPRLRFCAVLLSRNISGEPSNKLSRYCKENADISLKCSYYFCFCVSFFVFLCLMCFVSVHIFFNKKWWYIWISFSIFIFLMWRSELAFLKKSLEPFLILTSSVYFWYFIWLFNAAVPMFDKFNSLLHNLHLGKGDIIRSWWLKHKKAFKIWYFNK